MENKRIITKPPNIFQLSDFHGAYEQWRRLKGLHVVESTDDLAIKLSLEVTELNDALKRFQDEPNPLEVACEAADIFCFGMTTAYNIAGLALEDILDINGLKIGSFEELEKYVRLLNSSHRILSPIQVMPQISDTLESLTTGLRQSYNLHPILRRSSDLIILSSMVIQSLELPIGPIINGKLHRNAVKYPKNGQSMKDQKDGWNSNLDEQFLLLHLGEIDQITL